MSNPGISSSIAIPEFTSFWNERLETSARRIATAWRAPPQYVEPILLSALRRFARFAFLSPASKSHHDAQPGGLVAHTFLVIERALHQCPSTFTWEDRLAVIMQCTIHDAAKVWLVRLECVEPANITDRVWEPHYESQVTWIERIKARRIALTWRDVPSHTGPYNLEPLGTFLISHFFNLSVLPLLGRRRANSLLWSVTRHVMQPTVDYFTPFKTADRSAVARAVPMTTTQPIAVIMATVAQHIASSETELDPAYRDVLVSPTHTIIALGHGRERTIWNMALDEASEDATINFDEIERRVLADARWRRWTGPLPEVPTDLVKHWIELSCGRRFIAVIVANASLGLATPESHIFQQPIACEPFRRTGSGLDPESLGFRALPRDKVAQILHSPPPHHEKPDVELGKVAAAKALAASRNKKLCAAFLAAVGDEPSGRHAELRTRLTTATTVPAELLDEVLDVLVALLEQRESTSPVVSTPEAFTF